MAGSWSREREDGRGVWKRVIGLRAACRSLLRKIEFDLAGKVKRERAILLYSEAASFTITIHE